MDDKELQKEPLSSGLQVQDVEPIAETCMFLFHWSYRSLSIKKLSVNQLNEVKSQKIDIAQTVSSEFLSNVCDHNS